MKNQHGKTRDVGDPYHIFLGDNGWEWRVLKRYQSPEAEMKNPMARWLCAVRSPFTYGSWEYGDTYIHDIPGASRGQAFSESTIRKDGGCIITTATITPLDGAVKNR